ncbi:MAG TPA: proline racemase family protein, partial [Gemmataceae bacterium]|nr:proline racemase family protein [Gemmataceae bacterium]
RVVVDGGPDLGGGSLTARRDEFRQRFDWFRSAVVNEPRGSDVLVGALLTEPHEPGCCAGVVYFNNVSTLGMCGHGTIGVAVTLARLGRIGPGSHRLDTPVGVVGFELNGPNRVTVENVPSYRLQQGVELDVPGFGRVVGDVAWGGNWFFLADCHGLDLRLHSVERLTDIAWRIRRELARHGITGTGAAVIDHIELTGPPHDRGNHGRNFVLCPGGAYDRSPCGTGTSAKLACLYADGKLRPGDVWRQESVVGSVFDGSVRVENGKVIPRITGSAYVTAEATLILDPADPIRAGLAGAN